MNHTPFSPNKGRPSSTRRPSRRSASERAKWKAAAAVSNFADDLSLFRLRTTKVAEMGFRDGEVTFEKELGSSSSYFQMRNLGTLVTAVTDTYSYHYSRYRLVRYRIRRKIGYNAMLFVCVCVCGKLFRVRNR